MTHPHQISIPGKPAADPNAIELARIWSSEGHQHFALNVQPDLETWRRAPKGLDREQDEAGSGNGLLPCPWRDRNALQDNCVVALHHWRGRVCTESSCAGVAGLPISNDFELRRRDAGQGILLRLRKWPARAEEVLRENDVRHIAIEDGWTDDAGGLEALSQLCPQLEGLTFGKVLPAGWSVIYELPQLRQLSARCDVRAIEFGRLHVLESAHINHASGPGSVATAPRLSGLSLVSSRIQDLRLLTASPVTSLSLMLCSGLRRLDGMPPGVQALKLVKLPRLEHVEGVRAAELMAVLELHNVPNVRDLIAIAGLKQLRELHIEAGPELTDFAFVEGLIHLERMLMTVQKVSPSLASVAPLSTLVALRELWLDLRLESVGDVFELFKLPKLRILRLSRLGGRESIRGLSMANTLEDVELGQISVTDGDMTPFLSLPRLRPSGRLFYPDLKHYSHTLQQVNEIIM